MDYDLYERAVYSEQNRLDYFLTLQKGERMKSMDRLLGIDRWELVRKGLGTLSNRVSDRAKDLAERVSQLKIDPSLPKLPEYERELASLEDSKKQMADELRRLKPELDELNRQVQSYRELERRISELESRHSGLASAVKEIESRVAQLKDRLGADAGVSVVELQNKVQQQDQDYRAKLAIQKKAESETSNFLLELRSSEHQLQSLKLEAQKLLSDVESRRRSKEELEKIKPDELMVSVEKMQSEVKQLGDDQAALNARMQDLKHSVVDLSKAEAQCPVCDSALEQAKKQELITKKQRQLEDFQKRSADIGTRLDGLNKELKDKLNLQIRVILLAKDAGELPAKEADYSRVLEQAGLLEGKLPGLRTEWERSTKEAEVTKSDTESAREALVQVQQRLELRLDLERQEAGLKLKLEERLLVGRELEAAKSTYEPAKVKEVGEKRDLLLQRCSELDARVKGIGQLIVEKENFVRNIREKLGEIRRGEVKAKHFKRAVEALVTVQTAVSRTQTAMRQMFMDGVNEVLGDFWDSVYPYGDYVGVRLAVESEDKGSDYILQLRDRDGSWVPVEGIASGGERTDACLVLRIAFSTVLAPNLSWIVFDEPTHNLDSEGIQELAKAMRERLPQKVRQILLITHEERLEAAVSGYLYRFYRDKAAGEPTRVERVSAPEMFE
ncbi:MAG: hypothetical protein AB1305_05825, partial [Candidatus Hadarchaeota archaeon]